MNKEKTLKEIFKEKINYDEIYDNVMQKVSPSVKKVPVLKYVAMPALIATVICGGIAIKAIRKSK